jgi:hypothetical protein
MALDARRYNAMLMRKRVAGLWLERDGFEEGAVAEGLVERESNGFDASVYDGLGGGRLGSRGVALYIIELTAGSATHFVVFFAGRGPYQSCHFEP